MTHHRLHEVYPCARNTQNDDINNVYDQAFQARRQVQFLQYYHQVALQFLHHNGHIGPVYLIFDYVI